MKTIVARKFKTGGQKFATISNDSNNQSVDAIDMAMGEDLYSGIIDTSSPTTQYRGWCKAGLVASIGSAVWRIQRAALSGGAPTQIDWADGNLLFDNVWNNRASLSYS